jgi:hypothetical protein
MRSIHRITLAAILAVVVLSPRARADTIAVDGYPVTIEYEQGQRKVADKIAEICRDQLPRLASELGLADVQPFRVFLIGDMEAFESAQGIRLPAWGVAFAFMDNQIMLVDVRRATKTWDGLDHIIPHELSHLLVAQRVSGVPMPLWFLEGLALWQAREWSLSENWRLMEAVWANRAPTLVQIHDAMPAAESRARDAYRVAYTAITARFNGDLDALPAFLDEVVSTGDFSEAFESYWNESEIQYSLRFAGDLDHKYKSRLLLFQAGPLFSVVAVLFVLIYIWVRVRSQRKLKHMEDVDRGLKMDDY